MLVLACLYGMYGSLLECPRRANNETGEIRRDHNNDGGNDFSGNILLIKVARGPPVVPDRTPTNAGYASASGY